MLELIKYNDKRLISAKDVYDMLNVSSQFSSWITRGLKNAWLVKNEDYFIYVHVRKSDNQHNTGRSFTDYLLTENSALAIIVMSRVKNAQLVRNEVIKTFQQKQKGQSFEINEIHALIDLSKAMTLVSIQQKVERKHFAIYNDKYTWYAYRAEILGYSTEILIDAMQKVNKKHKSIRKSLVKLDSNELIRTGIIDFFIALGKDKEYAINAGNLCKKFASEMKLGNQIWDDTKENPLKLNSNEANERKNLFNKSNDKLN
jgi:phage anti-repressor protein